MQLSAKKSSLNLRRSTPPKTAWPLTTVVLLYYSCLTELTTAILATTSVASHAMQKGLRGFLSGGKKKITNSLISFGWNKFISSVCKQGVFNSYGIF